MIDAVVTELRHEARGVVSLVLRRVDAGALPCWRPGAHLDLALPTGITRQYSIIDAGEDLSWYRVAVLHEPNSRGGSEYVHMFLRPGQLVGIGGPRNHFALDEATSYRFIVGGIGITPVLPMVGAVARSGVPWTLCYGGRTRAGMSFVDRLRVYQDRVTIWPEDECGQLPLAQLLAPGEPGSLLYCCGPPGLLDAVTAMAKDLGWPEEAVRIERFQPKAKPTDVPDRSLQVRANRSNRDVAVAADESILDALLHAGVTVPYTCREGVCGTCEVGVLGGRPDHRDDVLTTAQRESGKTMLVCVSRAEDDGLVLDI